MFRTCGVALFGIVLFWLAALLLGCSSDPAVPAVPVARFPGQVIENQDVFGVFYTYVPEALPANPEVLVLVHGTPGKHETAEANAHYYAKTWRSFAEQHGCILMAPAFNQEDFSSRRGDHAQSGYRGLFGREINADEWVLRLGRAYQEAFGAAGRPFYLYGHSAGGQFVARFLVTHPEAVKRAVITSAATYPQPDPAVAWPYGLGELHADVIWDEQTTRRVDVVPDRKKWLAATQVPLTVIVGLNDTGELEGYPGQKGSNRFAIGRNWIQAMAAFAGENGLESRFKFEAIPGKGHSMGGLISYSQKALPAE